MLNYTVNKSKALRGQVRISLYYNNPWRGFTLQRGHFFGQDENGDYFVCGLEHGSNNTIAVYAMNEHGAKWYKYYLPVSHPLCQRILAAIPERKALGISGVEFQPLDLAIKHGKVKPQTTRRECWCYCK